MAENIKQFGLEFVLRNNSQREFQKIMDQQKRLEKQLTNTVNAFNKLQSSVNNTKFDNAERKINRLTNSVKEYNRAMQGATGGNIGPNVGSPNSSMSDFMSADFFRDSIHGMAQQLTGAFDSIPFGNIVGSIVSNSFDGIATSLATGNIIPALTGLLTGGLESAMGIYRSSSEFVHNAIFSAFQKGAQLVVQAMSTLIPQTLGREYDQAKLSAVLGDKGLSSTLTNMGVDYAKNSSLSLQDIDFVLPNLVMANKASGLTNSNMEKAIQKQLEAITRLNFKDSGQGAGVTGSLVALQEMLAGDYISLQRRFEMSGASVDRIKAAADSGGVMAQMDQLVKELEMMGVTTEALQEVQQSTKFKMGFIAETLTDFFTNPSSGIIATMIEPFKGVVDNVTEFLETGGGIVSTGLDLEGNKIVLTELDAMIFAIKDVFTKIGEVGFKLGDAVVNNLIMQIDWSALWDNVSSLIDSISAYFKPSMDRLAEWINSSFIPWIGELAELLNRGDIQEGILGFIDGLTGILDNSMKLTTKVIEATPTISKVIDSINGFVDGCMTVVSGAVKAMDKLKSFVDSMIPSLPTINIPPFLMSKKNPEKKAVGLPYVGRDNMPVLLHKGERVLTAQQNRNYNQGSGGSVIPKLADTIVVREEADITKIANTLVRKLNENRLVYGGGW